MPGIADQAEEYLRFQRLAEQAIQGWNQLISQAVDEVLAPAGSDQEAKRTIARAAAQDLRKLAEWLDGL